MQLSDRLQAVASMVTENSRLDSLWDGMDKLIRGFANIS